MQAVVTDVTEEYVEIDANPPLAGQGLTFDVELVNLVKGARVQQALFGAGEVVTGLWLGGAVL